MKKIMFILLAIISLSVNAQKKPKVKGNREVLIKKFPVASFTAIEVGETFNVKLEKATDDPLIVIETDDNLFDIIHFVVEENILRFWTSMEIVKKKRLRITAYVPEDFNKIKLVDKGEVFTDGQLKLNMLNIEASNKSEAKLNLRVKNDLVITASDKSDLELEASAQKVQFKLTADADLKAIIDTKTAGIEIDKSADCELEGSTNQLDLKAAGKSKITAEKFVAKEATLSVSGKSNVYTNTSKKITLNLSGKTETYLYGSPEIILKSFKDNAALFKK